MPASHLTEGGLAAPEEFVNGLAGLFAYVGPPVWSAISQNHPEFHPLTHPLGTRSMAYTVSAPYEISRSPPVREHPPRAAPVPVPSLGPRTPAPRPPPPTPPSPDSLRARVPR
jgi:hypothetical protein